MLLDVSLQNYQRHLTLRAIGTEDFAMLGDADSLALEQVRDMEEQPSIEPPTPARRGRKRKIVEDVVSTNLLFVLLFIYLNVCIHILPSHTKHYFSFLPKGQDAPAPTRTAGNAVHAAGGGAGGHDAVHAHASHPAARAAHASGTSHSAARASHAVHAHAPNGRRAGHHAPAFDAGLPGHARAIGLSGHAGSAHASRTHG